MLMWKHNKGNYLAEAKLRRDGGQVNQLSP